jgi:hypothetical protein
MCPVQFLPSFGGLAPVPRVAHPVARPVSPDVCCKAPPVTETARATRTLLAVVLPGILLTDCLLYQSRFRFDDGRVIGVVVNRGQLSGSRP